MPWKGVVHFGKKGNLEPRYVGPFEILELIVLAAYRLRLLEELNSVHDTFHVLNMKKCLADANLHVPLDEIKVDKTLCFIEEPVEIMDREIKKLKRRKLALVKVRWNSKCGPEFTWEHEDQMRIKLVIPLEMAKGSFCVISCVLLIMERNGVLHAMLRQQLDNFVLSVYEKRVMLEISEARTLISHGCQGFLASVMDTSLECPNIENLFVVCEFADVFPDELPGLPPAREIEFGI
ncbi:hypothetical protein Tco_1301136 [Tanacetum coccineum]